MTQILAMVVGSGESAQRILDSGINPQTGKKLTRKAKQHFQQIADAGKRAEPAFERQKEIVRERRAKMMLEEQEKQKQIKSTGG